MKNKPLLRKSSNGILYAMLALLIVTYFIYANENIETFALWYSDIITIIISGAIVFFGIVCYKQLGNRFSNEKKTIGFLTAAFGLRFLAEIFWGYYELFLGDAPLVSTADVFWIASHVFVIIGLGYIIKNTFIYQKEKIVSTAIALGTAVILIVGRIALAKASESGYEDLFSLIVNFSYVAYDIIVVSLLLVLLYPMMGSYNILFKPFMLLAVGFIAFAVFDFGYYAEILIGDYSSGGVLDILYDAAYLFVLAGFYFNSKELRTA